MYHIDEHAEMFTPAERAALTLAERMTTDARGVDEEVGGPTRAFRRGRDHRAGRCDWVVQLLQPFQRRAEGSHHSRSFLDDTRVTRRFRVTNQTMTNWVDKT